MKFFKPVNTNCSPIDIKISPIKLVTVFWPPLFTLPDARTITSMTIHVSKTARLTPPIAITGYPALSCTAESAITVAIVPGLAANMINVDSVFLSV